MQTVIHFATGIENNRREVNEINGVKNSALNEKLYTVSEDVKPFTPVVFYTSCKKINSDYYPLQGGILDGRLFSNSGIAS
ncbi:hypothetical protein AAEO50_03530 [Rossellomorea oryzaecorticis]|uniref:Uncharacterized protein n=1 Tax=Rossellomorea oryzaecorticis TaxID=1396505 RepID=A0ABU9K5R6_9BACI